MIKDFLRLELGSSDIILVMLETLGFMYVNWKDLSMKFKMGGVAVNLIGDPSVSMSAGFIEGFNESI